MARMLPSRFDGFEGKRDGEHDGQPSSLVRCPRGTMAERPRGMDRRRRYQSGRLPSDVAEAMSKSARDFVECVWPVVRDMVGGGDLEPVEAVTASGYARQLDMLAGIDGWQVRGDKGMRGIASRVRYLDRPRTPSFTIRSSRRSGAATEYQKRMRALREPDEGYLFPHWTVQAYLTEDRSRLLLAAAIRTAALFSFVERALAYQLLEDPKMIREATDLLGVNPSRVVRRHTRDSQFISVAWPVLRSVHWEHVGVSEPRFQIWRSQP